MSVRKILLIIMLAALAGSALTGILAVFVTSGDFPWRLMGTAVDTAVVSALLLPLTFLTERKVRPGGLAMMATLLIGWLCVMLLLWMPYSGSHEIQWRVAATLGFTMLCGLPGSAALLLTNVKQARFTAWTLVALAAYAWLGTLSGTWIPEGSSSLIYHGWLAGRIWGTALIPYGIGAIASLLLVNCGMGDRRHFRWVGLLCGLIAIVIAVAAVWAESSNEFWGRACGIALTVCCVLAHSNVVLLARVRRSQDWLKWATIAGALATGLVIIIILSTDRPGSWDNSYLFRAASALAIAAGCGSIAVIIISALNFRVDTPMVPSVDMKDIQLNCPRCGIRQTLPLGEAACKSCQLQIFTRVVEPRCPACGYNLFKLTSNRCPECGAAIPVLHAAPA